MKHCDFVKLLLVIALCFGLAGCDDDNNNDVKEESQFRYTYNNKWGRPERSNPLELTYGNRPMTGREAYFCLNDDGTADLAFFSIIPGYETLDITGIPVIPTMDGYSFSGTFITNNNTSFSYDGTATGTLMTLNISNISLPSNVYSQTGRWNLVHHKPSEKVNGYTYNHASLAFRITDDPVTYASFLGELLSPLLSLLLDGVTFYEDGTLTARYAPIPEGVDILNDVMMGGQAIERPASDWITTERNWVQYYIRDGYLYVLPNVDMICRSIFEPSTRAEGENTEGEESEGLNYEEIWNAYQRLTYWFSDGMKFTLRENPQTAVDGVRYEGEYFLYLDKTQLDWLPALLELVGELLPDDLFDDQMINNLINNLLNNLGNEIDKGEDVELGLYFN